LGYPIFLNLGEIVFGRVEKAVTMIGCGKRMETFGIAWKFVDSSHLAIKSSSRYSTSEPASSTSGAIP